MIYMSKIADVNNFFEGVKESREVEMTVNISDKIYTVKHLPPTPDMLQKGLAYIVDKDFVLPYRGSTMSGEPGVYKAEGSIKIKLPESDKEKKLYDRGRVIILDPEFIKNNLSDRIEIPHTVNESTQFTIDEDDNVLMILLKQAINAKGINVHQYKERFKGSFQNDLKPFKPAVKQKQALTLDKFLSWCDNLDIEWKFQVKANNKEAYGFEDIFEISSDHWVDEE